jgi:hypothetical protein
MAVIPNPPEKSGQALKGIFACESVPRNKTTKILMMATGQGLRERFRGRKALALAATLNLVKKALKTEQTE